MLDLEIDLYVKIAVAVLGFPASLKIIFDLSKSKKSELREEYRFSREFLNDLKSNLHHHAVEKGYAGMSGTTNLVSSEIEYFLSDKFSSQDIKTYARSKRILVFNEAATRNSERLDFVPRYKQSKFRQFMKGLHIFTAIFSYTIAVLPFLFSSSFATIGILSTVIYLLFISLPLIFSTINAVKNNFNVKESEVLVEKVKTLAG